MMISPPPYPLVLSLAGRIVPLVLSLSKDGRTYEAHHERFLIACTTPARPELVEG